jgi:hypothetical protein
MSKDNGFTASANVRVTIEVQNLGPYGADWTAEKIHEQTGKEAIEKVLRLLASCQHCGDPPFRDPFLKRIYAY